MLEPTKLSMLFRISYCIDQLFMCYCGIEGSTLNASFSLRLSPPLYTPQLRVLVL